MKLLKGLSSIRGTKRALIASAACTLLCGLLLFSTSIAWFTANKESNVNELYSGNLDVRLWYSKDMNAWDEVKDSTDDIFKVNVEGKDKPQNMLWEPGAVNVVYFKIENKGNLAAKYDFAVVIDSEVGGTNFAGQPFKLSENIRGGVVLPSEGNELSAFQGNTEEAKRAAAVTALGNAPKALSAISGTTLVEGNMNGANDGATETKTFALVLYMPENAGDVTNYRTPNEGEKRPGVKLKVKLVATQNPNESDSFGNQYDEKAEVIMVLAGATADETKTNLENAINNATSGSTILLPEAKGEKKIILPEAVASIDVVIKGAGQDKTEIDRTGTQGLPHANLNISDVTLVGGTANYQGFQHTDTEYYENCKFTGKTFFYGSKVVCKNCVFEQTADPYDYCFWTYGAKNITFENCTFITKGKAAKVYNEDGTGTYNITFNNCHFNIVEGHNNTGDKPAVAIASCGAKFNVTMTGCDQTGYKSKQDSALTDWYNAANVPDEVAVFFGCECKTNATVTPATTGKLSDMTVIFNGTTYSCPAN